MADSDLREQTARAFINKGVALGSLGRYDEALAAHEDTIRRFPHNEVARNAYAETLRDLGRYHEALATFEGTLRRFSHDAVAPIAYAETLRDYEEARDDPTRPFDGQAP